VGRIGWLAVEALERLRSRAVALVSEHHEKNPLDPGLKLQTLRERLAQIAGDESTAEVIGRLTKARDLVVESDTVRLPTFKGAQAHAESARALAGAKAALTEAALGGMTELAMSERLRADAKQVRAIFAVLSREGAAIHAGDLWFDAAAVERLRARLVEHFTKASVLTIQQFKDITGLGRKQTIPLLEHFDRTKVTRRQGSDRVKG
jgi:selenocysteine-specific elongation factor